MRQDHFDQVRNEEVYICFVSNYKVIEHAGIGRRLDAGEDSSQVFFTN